MLADDGIVFRAHAQADVLVGDALDHLQQHRGIVDMLGIGRHRGGQRLLLLAALLVALVEQLAQRPARGLRGSTYCGSFDVAAKN
ncbi:Uncharacterised protein [Bordetella pertussis]|nr:Uncharacterised protein [Bordetella pertussis]